MRSDGNVRVQFNLPENVAMSLYAMECLDAFGDTLRVGDHVPEPSMRRQGNLFLTDDDGIEAAHAGLATQRQLGADAVWLDMDEVTARYPALESDVLAGGTFGPNDGSVDPAAVVEGYRRRSVADGARSIHAEAASLEIAEGVASGVRLVDGSKVQADVIVVASGAWSTGLLATAGVTIPVDPVMRTVYVVAVDVDGGDHLPSVFLPSGVYLLPEHDGTFLVSWSMDDDPVGFDFTPAPRSRFTDVIWPELVRCLPAFDRLDVVGSWAGLYAQNRLDSNAIIGEWPTVGGLWLATGFSGHGFQHCHGVGRHLAESITGAGTSLDLRRLGPERVVAREPLLEHVGRII